MLIFDNLSDINAIYGILQKVGDECNYYWNNSDEIDYDKAEYGSHLELQEYLIKHRFIDSGYDLVKLTYHLRDLYPTTPVAEENNRQYHEVLNRLDESTRRNFLGDIHKIEKDVGENLDKSTKFNMALELLLKENNVDVEEE
tara:strand:- start:1215 stop:1640 length:426 start_codon:yes stop_codon:yes gene_type:complete